MRLSDTPLSVVANPFAAPLDAKGRACALTEVDPTYPSAARYVGARPKVASVVKRPGNLFGDKAKVSVVYDLRPVKIVDTIYHRAKLASGEVFAAEGAQEKLVAAARARLTESSITRDVIFAAWRDQGLKAIADAIDPPAEQPKAASPGNLPPVSDVTREAPPGPGRMVAIGAKPGEAVTLNTEGAVS